MTNFPSIPMDSIAGLDLFYFIPVEDVTQIPRRINQVISSLITLESGKSWYKGYAALDSQRYSEKGRRDEQGNYFESSLQGFVPESQDMLKLFSEMDGRKFIVWAKDNDGMHKILGTLDEPLELSADFDTQIVSGYKGYNYEFAGILTKRSPIYTAASSPAQSSSTSSSGM